MNAISEIAVLLRNGKSVRQSAELNGLPITRIETIADGTINPAKVGFADLEESDCTDWLLQDGDILISHINSTKHLGKCAIYQGDPPALIHGMNLLALRVDPDVAASRYVYWMLSSTGFRRKLPRITKDSVNQSSFNISSFKKLQIPLPPLDEQRRIAEILDKADALRARRRAALAYLDTLTQSIFLDMFGDPVTNPMGWEVVAFESIGNSRLGKMLDKGKEVGDCQFPYLANTNVQWGRFDLAALRTMDFSESDCEEFKLENGDLLICEGGEVGRTAIWHGAHDRIYFQKALHRVRLDPTVAVPEYVFQFMWFMAKNGGFRHLTTSATIAHLTGVKLKRLPCPRPPLELQHRFATIVESVEHQKANQRAHLAELDTLFASQQSRAFRGEL